MEQAVSSKPARIISMFSKKLESRDIAKKLGHESHDRHLDILELLDSKKEKLLELLNSDSNEDMAMPRYVIG